MISSVASTSRTPETRHARHPAASSAEAARLGQGLRRSRFLQRLRRPTIELFLAAGSIRTVERDMRFQPEDGANDWLLVVASGAVKTHMSSRTGSERLVGITGVGGVLNAAPVITETAESPGVTALVVTTLLTIPGRIVRDEMAKAPEVGRAIAEELSLQQLVEQRAVAAMVDLDAAGRVAYRLTQLARDWGTETPRGRVIDLPLTQEELGAWAHVSRESAAKALQVLRAEGIVSTGRKLLVVHSLEALEERAGVEIIDLTDLAAHLA